MSPPKQVEPLSEEELCLIEIHANGKLEREQPNVAAICRGLLFTIRADKARVAELEETLEQIDQQCHAALDGGQIHHWRGAIEDVLRTARATLNREPKDA